VRETLHGRVACYLAYFLPPNTLELLLDSEWSQRAQFTQCVHCPLCCGRYLGTQSS
jgi:hypothetical protein